MTTPNIEELLAAAKDLQEKIGKEQEKLKELTVIGESGGGLVKCYMNVGKKRVIKFEIDDSIKNDLEFLNDLVVASVNIALEKSKEEESKHISPLASGMNFNF